MAKRQTATKGCVTYRWWDFDAMPVAALNSLDALFLRDQAARKVGRKPVTKACDPQDARGAVRTAKAMVIMREDGHHGVQGLAPTWDDGDSMAVSSWSREEFDTYWRKRFGARQLPASQRRWLKKF